MRGLARSLHPQLPDPVELLAALPGVQPERQENAVPPTRRPRWAAARSEVCSSTRAVSGVAYLKRLLLDNQLLSLGAVEKWEPTDAAEQRERFLILDAKALDNLEVFENSSDRGAKGTLFSVVNHCASPFGKRALRGWLCRPLARVDAPLPVAHVAVGHAEPGLGVRRRRL